MTNRIVLSAAAVLGLATAQPLLAATMPARYAAASTLAVHRFALVIGANSGGGNRSTLRFAVSDAERFRRVLVELGGVAPADALLLEQPGLRDLEGALETLRERVQSARDGGDAETRTEVLVYYSGHADEMGLLLAGDRYSYRTLRDKMDGIRADVCIAVLDACASGAITRLKGGQPRAAFLVDASTSMRGHAFLTSSSADEAAQESDRVGASFFTHYLISGLRGAADASGEGLVTLSEAYQFAFRETLGRTVETRGGAQHPSYDINLSGTGDVIMTDLRQTSAGLVLGEEVGGRCFVRDAEKALVVELRKPKDRKVELGLEPGRYEVSCQDEATALVARPVLPEGGRVVLGPSDFTSTSRLATMARGTESRPAPGELNGRNRIDIWAGVRDAASAYTNDVRRIGYSRWLRPSLAVGLAYSDDSSSRYETESANEFSVESSSLSSVVFTVRRDIPTWTPRLRPYASIGVGPFFRSVESRTVTTETHPLEGGGSYSAQTLTGASHTDVGFGARFSGGIDFLLTRHLSVGGSFGYDLVTRFPPLLNGRRDYSAFEFGARLGWVFGRGTAPKR
jgi:hypothetical protein